MAAITPPPPYGSAIQPQDSNILRERHVSSEPAESPLDEEYALHGRVCYEPSIRDDCISILCCCCILLSMSDVIPWTTRGLQDANFYRSITSSNIPGAIKAIREGSVNSVYSGTIVDLAQKGKWDTISFLMGQSITLSLDGKTEQVLWSDDTGKPLTHYREWQQARESSHSIAIAYQILNDNAETKKLADQISTIYQEYVKSGRFKL